ncbi:MAG: hypothetical protein JSS99_12900 [Actinobacteria bacterium]|nr:hypothetical protein [Actinomycetota bacterium]
MTLRPTYMGIGVVALLAASLICSGGASASEQEWRVGTKGTVESARFSNNRLVWAERVGSNGFRIFTARLGGRPHLAAWLPDHRVRLGNEGDDFGYLSLAAWPGGIAYAYSHEHCFQGCFGNADTAANPYSATMRIVVAPFGRPSRVLWARSCRPGLHTRPQVAIAGQTLLTSHGSCTYTPSTVEESDLFGSARRQLPGRAWTNTVYLPLQASGRFAAIAQPPAGFDTHSSTAVIDLRARRIVLSIPLDDDPVALASDGALIFATRPYGGAPWNIAWSSPAEPSPHPVTDNVSAIWPILLAAHGRIAVVRTRPIGQPTAVDVFARSGRRLGGLARAVHGKFGDDVFGFDGRRIAWVVRGARLAGPETIVVRCVLACQ